MKKYTGQGWESAEFHINGAELRVTNADGEVEFSGFDLMMFDRPEDIHNIATWLHEVADSLESGRPNPEWEHA